MNECNEVGRKRKKAGPNCGMDKVNLYFEIFDKDWKESALDVHGFAFRCTGTDAGRAQQNFSLFLDSSRFGGGGISFIGFTLYSHPRVLPGCVWLVSGISW